jgi:hypothetical protein
VGLDGGALDDEEEGGDEEDVVDDEDDRGDDVAPLFGALGGDDGEPIVEVGDAVVIASSPPTLPVHAHASDVARKSAATHATSRPSRNQTDAIHRMNRASWATRSLGQG